MVRNVFNVNLYYECSAYYSNFFPSCEKLLLLLRPVAFPLSKHEGIFFGNGLKAKYHNGFGFAALAFAFFQSLHVPFSFINVWITLIVVTIYRVPVSLFSLF